MAYKVWYLVKKCPNCDYIISRKRDNGGNDYDTKFKRCPYCEKIMITGSFLFDDYTKEEIKENEKIYKKVWIGTIAMYASSPLIGILFNHKIIPEGFIIFWCIIIMLGAYVSLLYLASFIRDRFRTFGQLVKKNDKELYALEMLATYFIENGINRNEAVRIAYNKYLNGEILAGKDFDNLKELDKLKKAEKKNEHKTEEQYMCENCGAFVSASDKECPNCGELFEEEDIENEIEYQDVEELYVKANNYEKNNDRKTAKKYYEKYIEETEKIMKSNDKKCYTFGNCVEFVIAVKKGLTDGDCVDLNYNTSDAYLNLAIFEFEDKEYDSAIKLLNKSLKLNPLGISTLFEKAENYKAKEELKEFYNWTEKCYERLYHVSQLAHYYRNLGYYYIEKKNWELAKALYLYSLKYENNPVVEKELQYIVTISNNEKLPKKEELTSILRKNNIPTFINKENLKILKEMFKELEDNNQLNSGAGRFVEKIMKDNSNN